LVRVIEAERNRPFDRSIRDEGDVVGMLNRIGVDSRLLEGRKPDS
jgi:hypothetical protein